MLEIIVDKVKNISYLVPKQILNFVISNILFLIGGNLVIYKKAFLNCGPIFMAHNLAKVIAMFNDGCSF